MIEGLGDMKEPAIGLAGFVIAKFLRIFEKNTSELGIMRERIGQLEMQNKAAFREIDLLREEIKELRHAS